MSHRPVEDCKKCLHIEKWDIGPARLDVETQLEDRTIYRWEHGSFQTKTYSEDVQALCANPTLDQNIKELCRLWKVLPDAVADIFWAKKEGRQSSKKQQQQGGAEFKLLCCRWDSLKVNPNGLLMMMLAADNRHQEKKRSNGN